MERHTVSRLIGAPPGYVGFDQGGLLTDAIDQHPHCVLLLDEIEKAHPDLFNILLQIMDHGKLTDHSGKQIDFRNVILIMTTNAGARDLARRGLRLPQVEARGRRHRGDRPAVRAGVPQPARRHRAVRAPAGEVIARVVDKFILQLEAQLADRNVTIELTDEARDWLVKNGYDEAMGARPMARVIQTQIKTPLADEVLFGRLKNGGVVKVVVTGDETGEKKLGFVYPEGPAQPRLERDLIVAAEARGVAQAGRAGQFGRGRQGAGSRRAVEGPTEPPWRLRPASRLVLLAFCDRVIRRAEFAWSRDPSQNVGESCRPLANRHRIC